MIDSLGEVYTELAAVYSHLKSARKDIFHCFSFAFKREMRMKKGAGPFMPQHTTYHTVQPKFLISIWHMELLGSSRCWPANGVNHQVWCTAAVPAAPATHLLYTYRERKRIERKTDREKSRVYITFALEVHSLWGACNGSERVLNISPVKVCSVCKQDTTKGTGEELKEP
jgi:hypothetical protein